MENREIKNSEIVAFYPFSYSWKWLQRMRSSVPYTQVLRVQSHNCCGKDVAAEEQNPFRISLTLSMPCHQTHFLDDLNSTFFIHKMSFLSPLISVSTAFQWNFTFLDSYKKFNREVWRVNSKNNTLEDKNISSRDNVKGDTRIILIPFLLTTKISCFCCYFFSSMLGKNCHVKKEQCLLVHSKIPSHWQPRTEKSLWKLLRGDSCPAQNFWESHLLRKHSLPLELERLNWLSRVWNRFHKGLEAWESPVSTQGQRELHLLQGDGFVTLKFLLPRSGIPTSAWQSYIRKPSATEATRTLSWRTVWKREFLICGKFQHSEICFSSAYKPEAKIPQWAVWNGSPGEEQGEGMEKIRKLPFEGKK